MTGNEAAKSNLKIKKNTGWKIAAVLFAVLLIISLLLFSFKKDNTEERNMTLKEKMCSSIKGTPAWADSEGNILTYGYKETLLVDDLIKDEIYFLYQPGCGWCHKQIEYFGEEWQEYVDSDYTVDCREILTAN